MSWSSFFIQDKFWHIWDKVPPHKVDVPPSSLNHRHTAIIFPSVEFCAHGASQILNVSQYQGRVDAFLVITQLTCGLCFIRVFKLDETIKDFEMSTAVYENRLGIVLSPEPC